MRGEYHKKNMGLMKVGALLDLIMWLWREMLIGERQGKAKEEIMQVTGELFLVFHNINEVFWAVRK